jgi:hypothetical protein
MSTNEELLTTPALQKTKVDTSEIKDIRLWTDDYSNLFQILK